MPAGLLVDWVRTHDRMQTRAFELHGDTLSYRVPPRPNGDVPISVWRRSKTGVRVDFPESAL